MSASSTQSAPAPQSPRTRVLLASALLFVLVAATFWPALHNTYVNYDDPDYLTGNEHVQSGLSWANIHWAFTTTTASNWHPLTWLSHMVDCQLYGEKLWGHHLTNVLLHSLNAVMVFLLFHRATGSCWRSLMLAACFGIHPLRVESVAWLSERKDVLSATFGLATLLAYIRYVRLSQITNETLVSRPALNYAVVVALFALSLLSKPMMVTLPCVMLLLDIWPLQRIGPAEWRHSITEKIPLLLLSAAAAVVTYLVQRSGGAMEQMAHFDTMHHALNALVSYVRYLEKFFWPTKLAPIYPVIDQWPMGIVTGAGVLLAAITALVIWLRKTATYALVGWFWFLGTLVPVIGLVAVGEQAMADRYTYFTQIGLALGLIWGAEAITRGWHGRIPAAAAFGLLILIPSAIKTQKQIRVWADSETLFRHTLAVTTNNYSAQANLSAALTEQGWFADALIHAQEAVRLRPDSPEAQANFGAALARVGRLDEAIVAFREFVRLRPAQADAHRNLATALLQSGRLDEAITEFETAVRLEPRNAWLRQGLAQALNARGRHDEAAQQMQEAARLQADGNRRP